MLFESEADIQTGLGVIFSKENITMEHAYIIVKRKPSFVGLSASFEFDLDVEKFLLEHDIISFERLANTHLLPKKCIFY
jgi:kynurenine formamidase